MESVVIEAALGTLHPLLLLRIAIFPDFPLLAFFFMGSLLLTVLLLFLLPMKDLTLLGLHILYAQAKSLE